MPINKEFSGFAYAGTTYASDHGLTYRGYGSLKLWAFGHNGASGYTGRSWWSEYGYYWTSLAYNNGNGQGYHFSNTGVSFNNGWWRAYGMIVRPARD